MTRLPDDKLYKLSTGEEAGRFEKFLYKMTESDKYGTKGRPDKDTIDILKREYEQGKFKGVIHCFTASEELAIEALKLDFYISVSGIITFKNAEDIRKTIKKVPMNRLLVETDAPYLAPVPNRGKRNEPAFVKDTAKFLSDLKGVSFEELANQTTHNFYNLFNKARM